MKMPRLPVLLSSAVAVTAIGFAVAAPASAVRTAGHLAAEPAQVITITGKLIGSDGQPASKVQVIARTRKLDLQMGGGGGASGAVPQFAAPRGEDGRYQILGKTISGSDGTFTLRGIKEKAMVQIVIGDKMKTDWEFKNVRNEGQNIDLGEVKLNASLGGSSKNDDNKGGEDGDRRR